MAEGKGSRTLSTNNLEAWWMPFTANRQFKKAPRLLVAAQGMHYRDADGRQILDGTAGLWCVNAGHGRRAKGDAHLIDFVLIRVMTRGVGSLLG